MSGRPALILDLGGVIVDHDNALMYERLRALLDARPEVAAIIKHISASGIGNGSIDAAQLFQSLRKAWGSTALQEEFLAAWCCHFTLKQDMFDYLGMLHRTSPIVLCSNTNAAHWDYIVEHFGVDRLLAKAILSHEVHWEKPGAEIYLLAAKAQGRAPRECLFVDDVLANVEAAQRLGFQTHHFMGLAGFRAALE